MVDNWFNKGGLMFQYFGLLVFVFNQLLLKNLFYLKRNLM